METGVRRGCWELLQENTELSIVCCGRSWDASAVSPPCAVKNIVPLMFVSLGTASECTAQLVQQLKTINPPESLVGEACFYLFGK